MSFKRIDWKKESEWKILSHPEFNALLEKYKAEGILVTESRTERRYWLEPMSYSVEYGDKRKLIMFCLGEDGEYHKYATFLDEDKNRRYGSGRKGGTFAYNSVNKKMSELYGVSLCMAFGQVKKTWKCMVPPPLLWQNEEKRNRIIRNCFKADVSSAFPFAGTMKLPDSHKKSRKEFDGTVPPTEEYPFAFYMRSRHIAVYGEFDTHDYKSYPVRDSRKHYIDIPLEEDHTVLMKASVYSLKDIMEELYEGRKENEDNKIIMNSFFGYLQSEGVWRSEYFMGHVTAVVISRINHRMLEVVNKICEEECRPLMVMTDSVVWQGRAAVKVDREKFLGAFYLEYEGVSVAYCRHGQYAIYDEEKGEVLLQKHQGYEEKEAEKKACRVKNLEDYIREFSGLFEYLTFGEGGFKKEKML